MSQDLTERKGTHVVHVRENSDHELDALFKAAMNPSQTGQSGSIPLRMRNLPPSFWKPPEPQRQMQHVKQGSNDSTGYPVSVAPGNCNTNLQVAHMRAHSSPATLQQTLSTVPQNPGQQPHHPRQHSCDLTEVGVEPLPPGWEMAKTPDGQRYYLNHITQTTQWVDPRKTSLNPSAISNQQSPPGSQQSPNSAAQLLGPLPPGWEQAVTPEGDVYYINHVERTTSWYDPRLLRLQQQQRLSSQNTCQGQGQRQMSPQVNPGQGQGQNRNQANLQFTQLQLEKERLRKRQEEIARQEMLLRLQMQQQQQSKQQQQGETTSQDIAISQANEMTSVTDPFLGQTNTSDHSRQESTDSGVGGMGSGTSYSLPRTPEDFLSNVDEMDTQDGGHRQGDFNNMDIGNITSDETSNMDSEDLVPSLQEDISNELLNDMENVLNSNKMDNLLTWL